MGTFRQASRRNQAGTGPSTHSRTGPRKARSRKGRPSQFVRRQRCRSRCNPSARFFLRPEMNGDCHFQSSAVQTTSSAASHLTSSFRPPRSHKKAGKYVSERHSQARPAAANVHVKGERSGGYLVDSTVTEKMYSQQHPNCGRRAKNSHQGAIMSVASIPVQPHRRQGRFRHAVSVKVCKRDAFSGHGALPCVPRHCRREFSSAHGPVCQAKRLC